MGDQTTSTSLPDSLVREYDRAWECLRAEQTNRTQLVGFFFTATFGTVALVSATTNGDVLNRPWRLALLSTIIFMATLVAALTSVSIGKTGVMFHHYAEIRDRLRGMLLEKHPELLATVSPPKYDDHRLWSNSVFTVQGSIESIVRMAALTETAVHWALAARALSLVGPTGPSAVLVALAVLASAAFAFLVVLAPRGFRAG